MPTKRAASSASSASSADKSSKDEAAVAASANDETVAGTDTRIPDTGPQEGAPDSGEQGEDGKTGLTVHLSGSSGFSRDVIAAVSAALREAELGEAKVKQFADKAAKAADLEQFWTHVQAWVRIT